MWARARSASGALAGVGCVTKLSTLWTVAWETLWAVTNGGDPGAARDREETGITFLLAA